MTFRALALRQNELEGLSFVCGFMAERDRYQRWKNGEHVNNLVEQEAFIDFRRVRNAESVEIQTFAQVFFFEVSLCFRGEGKDCKLSCSG